MELLESELEVEEEEEEYRQPMTHGEKTTRHEILSFNGKRERAAFILERIHLELDSLYIHNIYMVHHGTLVTAGDIIL